MTESTIPNALTPEEWANPLREVLGAADVELLSEKDRHRNAAICLEGHPYGFTQEDVKDLQWVASEFVVPETGPAVRLVRLAARIAALLPRPPLELVQSREFPDLPPDLQRKLDRHL